MTSQPSKFWLAVSVVCKLFHFESMGVTQHQGPNDDLNCAGVYIHASLVAILEQLLMYTVVQIVIQSSFLYSVEGGGRRKMRFTSSVVDL